MRRAPLLLLAVLVAAACSDRARIATGVAFFHKVGLDYVSCSPFRVPVARLAAAHAALGFISVED